MQKPKTAPMRLYEEESSLDAVSQKFGIQADEIIDFSVNVNPLGPPAVVFEEAANAIKAAGVYPDLYLKDLRAVLAARHDLDGDCFMFGAGLDDVLKLISQAWLGPQKSTLIHIPTFPRYELEAQFVGAPQVFVRSATPWQIDVSAIREALEVNAIEVAYLCTPNNPTGALISFDDIEDLVSSYPSTKFVVDEALADPSTPGAMSLVKKHANVIILRTFSKYFGLAGLRVGYAAGQPDLIASLASVRPPFNVSGFSAKIAIVALQNESFLDASRLAFKEERSYVSSQLEAFPAIKLRGSCSNMMMFSLEDRPADQFVEALAKQGILVVDATSFRGLEDVPSIRISLRTRPENTKLIEAIANVFG